MARRPSDPISTITLSCFAVSRPPCHILFLSILSFLYINSFDSRASLHSVSRFTRPSLCPFFFRCYAFYNRTLFSCSSSCDVRQLSLSPCSRPPALCLKYHSVSQVSRLVSLSLSFSAGVLMLCTGVLRGSIRPTASCCPPLLFLFCNRFIPSRRLSTHSWSSHLSISYSYIMSPGPARICTPRSHYSTHQCGLSYGLSAFLSAHLSLSLSLSLGVFGAHSRATRPVSLLLALSDVSSAQSTPRLPSCLPAIVCLPRRALSSLLACPRR